MRLRVSARSKRPLRGIAARLKKHIALEWALAIGTLSCASITHCAHYSPLGSWTRRSLGIAAHRASYTLKTFISHYSPFEDFYLPLLPRFGFWPMPRSAVLGLLGQGAARGMRQ
jgi:hypothetical protein